MTDTPMIWDVVIAAALGALVASAAFSLYTASRMKRAIATLDAANSEIFESLAAAERVLKSNDVPADIREAVLLMVKGMSSAELGTYMTKRLMNRQQQESGGNAGDAISNGLALLRDRNSALADDAERALVGLMALGLPTKYAGKRAPEVISHNVATPTRTLGVISKAMKDSHAVGRRRNDIGTAALA